MTKIMILICSIATPIEECSPLTALSSARGPDAYSAISCGLFGQAQLARSPLAPQTNEYEKIVCSTGGSRS
ncbi:hypothetical protein [Methylocella sp.]|uniref:hypothetical protein n=1 Tax=Methylocella sp. TaxID=1978226 RepID=UPI0035B0F37B